MTHLFFITHTPGRKPRAIRVFPPPKHRTHVAPQSGMQSAGRVDAPESAEIEPLPDIRGTGTPGSAVPPRHPASGLPADAASTPSMAPRLPEADPPADDDWLFNAETPR